MANKSNVYSVLVNGQVVFSGSSKSAHVVYSSFMNYFKQLLDSVDHDVYSAVFDNILIAYQPTLKGE